MSTPKHDPNTPQLPTITDHQLLDNLRDLAAAYIRKGACGLNLSAVEARIIQTSVQGVMGRCRLDDADDRMQAVWQMIENATKRTWKYEPPAAEETDGQDIPADEPQAPAATTPGAAPQSSERAPSRRAHIDPALHPASQPTVETPQNPPQSHNFCETNPTTEADQSAQNPIPTGVPHNPNRRRTLKLPDLVSTFRPPISTFRPKKANKSQQSDHNWP